MQPGLKARIPPARSSPQHLSEFATIRYDKYAFALLTEIRSIHTVT
jgi:hypothetical protein